VKIYPVIGDEMYVWVNPWADDFSNKVAKEKLQKITSVIDPVVRSELLGAKLVFVTENIESKNSLLKK
jgi:FAD synthase